MTGKQSLLAFIGVALIIANLITNRSTQTGGAGIVGTIFNSNASNSTVSAAHSELFGIAGEAGVLVFLIVLAGTSDGLANIALVFVIGLALVWGLTKYGGANVPAAASAAGDIFSRTKGAGGAAA